MLKFMIGAAVWVALFGAGAVFGLFDDSGHERHEVQPKLEKREADSLLTLDPSDPAESKPAAVSASASQLATKRRKTAGSEGVSLVGFDKKTHGETELQLDSAIRVNKERLFECTSKTRFAMAKPILYLEISFTVRRDPTGALQLVDVVLERSTASFDPLDEQCFIRELSQLRFRAEAFPEYRVFFPMCLHRRFTSPEQQPR